MRVELTWITPDAERLITHMARVSNPASQEAGTGQGALLRYLTKHKHWSPLEMASACFEIETTRDIARQILRHRSFSFQEFSQRYAEPGVLPPADEREARMQDKVNRQNSLPCSDPALSRWWNTRQRAVRRFSQRVYDAAIDEGIAKEVARAVLPEGLTTSRMYMAGTIRSWVHYLDSRTSMDTQQEHREVACAIRIQLSERLPLLFPTLLASLSQSG